MEVSLAMIEEYQDDERVYDSYQELHIFDKKSDIQSVFRLTGTAINSKKLKKIAKLLENY